MKPVRPSVNVNNPPQLGKRRQGDGGDDEGDRAESEEYSPTDAGDGPGGSENRDDIFGTGDGDMAVDEAKVLDPPTGSATEAPICIPCGNSRIPTKISSPIKPSAEDIDSHYCTGHLPYRNWCPVCVKSKGREAPHHRDVQDSADATGLPIVSFDYQTLNEETKHEQTVIIGKDESTGNVIAHHVTVKGLADDWAIRKVVKDLEELGRGHAIIKTDGEPAIVAVQNRLQALRDGRTVPRNPPAYDPQANGPCEKAVQDVTAQLRTIKIGLEARLNTVIHEDLPIVQWALEYAVFCINKFSVGKDGMTPHERLTGRKWRRQVVEFGETVLAKLALRRRQQGKAKKQKRKMAVRSIEGVWVGQVARTGEHVVIKHSGDAVRCRTIRRVPIEHRWDAEKVLLVKGTPRLPAPSTKRPEHMEGRLVDDEDREPRPRQERQRPREDVDMESKIDSSVENSGVGLEAPEARTRQDEIREFRINDRLLEKYGYTEGCVGCEYKQAGVSDHRGHTQACRARLRNAMEGDAEDKEILAKSQRRREQSTAQPAKRDQKASSGKESDEPNTAQSTPRFGAEDAVIDDASQENNVDGMDQDEIPELEETDIDMDSDEEEYRRDDPLREQKRQFDEELDDMEEEPVNKKPKLKVIAEKAKEAIKQLNSIIERVEVKEIIKKLEKDLRLRVPVNRRQRRTAAAARGKCDVAEVYSPPRITEMAKTMGLKDGWALDLTQVDPEDGRPWDFSDPGKQAKAKALLKSDEPLMLVACPMCDPFSQLNEVFNYPKQQKQDVENKIEDGLKHIKFTVELCLMQYQAGRLFLFEHPASASSWSAQSLQLLRSLQGVHHVNFDFCTLGMETTARDGQKVAARKRTGILTNSGAIASLLSEAQCRREHAHEHLLDGRAGPCQRYPDKFCKLICEGVKREIDSVEWRHRLYKMFDISTPFGQLMNVQSQLEDATPKEEDPFAAMYEDMDFIDDVSGLPLDKSIAVQARRTEMEFFKKRGVYTKRKRESWMKVIDTRWLDVNKGDEDHPNYRARLVGREIKKDRRDDLFAGTPPLESLRMLISICASNQHNWSPSENHVIMTSDIKRAYFYAPATRAIFIKIPREDWEDGDDERVGELNLSLYGTRDAAMNWAKTYSNFLVRLGFEAGRASPCNFYHPTREVSVTVHGDDFTSTGAERELRWLDGQMKSKFEVTSEILGPGPNHARQVRVLNRVLSWGSQGIDYEPDQRHAELITKAMGVTKAANTPGTRDDAAKAGPPSVTATTSTPIPEYRPTHDSWAATPVAADTSRDPLASLPAEGRPGYSRVARTGEAAYAVHIVEETGDCRDDAPMDRENVTQYRGLAARANYLAQDRVDIQFAVKEIARRMAAPVNRDWLLLKRLARYLLGAPRSITHYCWQNKPTSVQVYVDSDWAGCKTTARSTSGGAAQCGWHSIKTWSTTQTVVALSSGEAELYSLTKGAAQALGIMSMANDLGVKLEGMINTDASATLGIIQRQGLGKLRHIRTQYLWIQDRIRGGDLQAKKVPGTENPADMLTKHVSAGDLVRHAENLGVSLHSSRAEIAPHLAGVSTIELDDNEIDDWCEDGDEVIREHRRPRTTLFTPLRVQGAPPVKMLANVRITEGKYCDNGEAFHVVDTWTSRSTAHTSMPRRWIGSSKFFRRSDPVA